MEVRVVESATGSREKHKMTARNFIRDRALIAADDYKAGRIDRRTFLGICALAGVSPAVLSAGSALAADKPAQVVHANWGGDAVTCTQEGYGNSFTAETGVKVEIDGTGPLEGKIKAQVESGNVTWDCCDVDCFNIPRLARQDMLESIDYSIVDKNKILAPYTWDHGVLGYWYSFILAYDKTKVGDDAPKDWADFWNIDKYPGKRAFYKWMSGAPEAALMADGVPMEKVYPLDLDRAFKKIEEIKDHLVFWASGAESQQMFLQGEIVMGSIWHTRASVLERDTDGRIAWTWNQGNAGPAGWLIPKGNPAGREWANRWVAWMQDPKRQIEVMDCFGQGPANPAAADMMTPEQRRLHPAAPENLKQQIPINIEYFSEHYDEALNGYLDLISA
jgi:putative spermidine/putrescine transport system substrate-binding protein